MKNWKTTMMAREMCKECNGTGKDVEKTEIARKESGMPTLFVHCSFCNEDIPPGYLIIPMSEEWDPNIGNDLYYTGPPDGGGRDYGYECNHKSSGDFKFYQKYFSWREIEDLFKNNKPIVCPECGHKNYIEEYSETKYHLVYED